jgi:putrescine transport system substrate-binding protein
MMEPAVIAKVTNKTRFANGNAASLPVIDTQVRDNPAIHPGPEVRARLHPDLAESPEFSREMNRAWTRFRTGQ